MDKFLHSSMASMIPSKLLFLLLSQSQSVSSSLSVRHLLLLILHSLLFLLRLLRLLLSLAPSLLTTRRTPSADTITEADDKNRNDNTSISTSNSVARALSDVLSSMSRTPVWSRKYDLVRDLAERLIEGNHNHGGESLGKVNCAVLCSAFGGTIRRLEMEAEGRTGDRSSVWERVRRWKNEVREEEKRGVAGGEGEGAEKMAAELLWLVEKMVECGAVKEAVYLWGSAKELARASVAAEPRLQVGLVKVSAFLFKHLKEIEVGKCQDQDQLEEAAQCRMSMLVSWLPLLCRATNGTDSPVLSSYDRTEVVKVLEQTIEKLSRDQQEEILKLWLHHFTVCPHSDWPNLQYCYLQWYSKSRELLID